MEYPLKLSEIIAGCESGAWLKGARFESFHGDMIVFDGVSIKVYGHMLMVVNWRFDDYVD